MKIIIASSLIAALFCHNQQQHQVGAFTIPSPNSRIHPVSSSSCLHSATLNEVQVPTKQSPSPSIIQNENENETPIETTTQVEVEKSYLDDGFIFGLEGSGLSRPKGKVAQVVVEGDTLETQPYQVAAVVTTFANHATIASCAIHQLLQLNHYDIPTTILQSLLCIVSSWVLADFGSGVLHWSVDNYGNGRTPVMGSIIAAFQGHHTAPWTITERGFCNNVYKLCVPFGIPTVVAIALLAGPSHPLVSLFFTVFCSMEIMSQEFHKWSHMTKTQTSPFINQLQNIGLTIGRIPHAQHHLAPFEGNYCIISGICNPVLDKFGVFRWMEHMVWKMNGVESNAWKLDPELRSKTLRGEYAQNVGRVGRR